MKNSRSAPVGDVPLISRLAPTIEAFVKTG